MSYNPQNPNGQASSADSAPVVIANDQSNLPILVKDASGNGIASTASALNVHVTSTDVVSGTQGVNVTQVGGTNIDTNSGAKSAGTMRVVLATDQPQLSAALKVDASATTQPISASSLPLPALAATSTKQSDGSQKSQIVDGTGNVIGATANALDVNIKSGASSAFTVTDAASWTAGSSAAVPTMAVYNDSATALTSGQEGTLRSTSNRALHSNLRNASGTEIATNANPLRIDPTGTTVQPVSATALPLPTGAATAAKQPALGTAGAASADVITVQGIAGGTAQPISGTVTVQQSTASSLKVDLSGTAANATALKVDGSAVTQPISAGSLPLPSGAAQDSTLTGGTQKAVVRGGSKGATAAADVTSTSVDADTQALHVNVTNFPGSQTVAGTVTVTGVSTTANQTNGTQKTQVVDGSGNVIGATANALDVNIKSGNAGGTQYVEDAASAGGENMTLAGAVRQDTISSSTSTDGDYATLKVDSTGKLYGVDAEHALTGNGSVSSAANVFSLDLLGYNTVSVQVTSAGTTCTITYEQSNDNSTWVAVPVIDMTSITATATTTSTTVGLRGSPVTSRYFRARVSTYTSGTVTAYYVATAGSFMAPGVPSNMGSQTLGTLTTLTNITNWGNIVDNAGFTDGTTRLMPAGYILDEVAGTALTENDSAAARIDSKRAVVNVLEDTTNRGTRASVLTPADAAANTTSGLQVGTRGALYNGATWDMQRGPSIFKTATATSSGDTALWTPTAGKKFRLMRYQIQVTSDAAQASGGDIDIVLRDATTATAAAFSVFVPSSAGTTFGNTANSGWIDLGNGIISATINNVLNINLTAALTAGKVRVVVTGVEE